MPEYERLRKKLRMVESRVAHHSRERSLTPAQRSALPHSVSETGPSSRGTVSREDRRHSRTPVEKPCSSPSSSSSSPSSPSPSPPPKRRKKKARHSRSADRETHKPSSQQLNELRLSSRNLLRLSMLSGQMIGRNLAGLVAARRQLWLSQAHVLDGDKMALLDALTRLTQESVHCLASDILGGKKAVLSACPQAEAQSKKQEEQLERLRNDMGAVAMETTAPPDCTETEGPSDFILTRGNQDEEDEEIDSDTDDIDHNITEESKEAPAFQIFLKERKQVVKVEKVPWIDIGYVSIKISKRITSYAHLKFGKSIKTLNCTQRIRLPKNLQDSYMIFLERRITAPRQYCSNNVTSSSVSGTVLAVTIAAASLAAVAVPTSPASRTAVAASTSSASKAAVAVPTSPASVQPLLLPHPQPQDVKRIECMNCEGGHLVKWAHLGKLECVEGIPAKRVQVSCRYEVQTMATHTCDAKLWIKGPVVVFAELTRAEPGTEFESCWKRADMLDMY
ncbi:UNVERIFIED_CONTAM: hypothetical protein FKN15_066747 [Acipenser sinensis]